MKVHIDIETRSRADLPEVGAYRYGCDPSTRVLMAAVSEDKPYAPIYLWVHPDHRDAGVKSEPEAQELLIEATEVRAFNAPFEQAVMHGTSWRPFVGLEKFRCTQAMARIAGLPESLEKCGAALGIGSQKDYRGKALIRRFSIPKEDGTFNDPADFPEEWAQFCEYCRQDVRAEKEIHTRLNGYFGLRGDNLETFLYTMRMNARGIPVNVEALRNAQAIVEHVQSGAAAEFVKLTGLKITQRAKVLEWLRARGVELTDMQADTLQSVDAKMLLPECARVIELYTQLSFAAVKKIQSMFDWAMPDGRMRGVLKFYGAGTGRWSAGGPQIQNAKKATPAMRPITKTAYAAVSKGISAEDLSMIYGEPIEVLASCIRHFIHSPGREMLDADYNAIEARVICWLAKEANALKAWAAGTDQYKKMASVIYNVPVSGVTPDQRDMGKRTILGCGYGMGAPKFLSTCQLFGVDCDEALAERAVTAYRELHPRIVAYWRSLQNDAHAAVAAHGTWHGPFCVREAAGLTYLLMRLPSGRMIAYPHPQMEPDERGMQLTYWGQLPGKQLWGRIKLYGGKLAENASQAVAADVMSHGARKAEALGMAPFALIHDQGLALREDGKEASAFAAALAAPPSWAKDLPLKVEAKVVPYYSK